MVLPAKTKRNVKKKTPAKKKPAAKPLPANVKKPQEQAPAPPVEKEKRTRTTFIKETKTTFDHPELGELEATVFTTEFKGEVFKAKTRQLCADWRAEKLRAEKDAKALERESKKADKAKEKVRATVQKAKIAVAALQETKELKPYKAKLDEATAILSDIATSL